MLSSSNINNINNNIKNQINDHVFQEPVLSSLQNSQLLPPPLQRQSPPLVVSSSSTLIPPTFNTTSVPVPPTFTPYNNNNIHNDNNNNNVNTPLNRNSNKNSNIMISTEINPSVVPLSFLQKKNSINTNEIDIKKSSPNEMEMNLICAEYLKYANYHTTLHEFEQECENRGLAPHFLKELEFLEKNYPLQNNENFISLLNYFRQGDKNHFMEVWWKVLSELKKEMGIEAESGLAEDTKTDTKTETNNTTTATMIAQNLEFNIQVYFAIYPIHDYVDRSQSKMLDINTTMMEFKKYLEKNSTKLSQSPQYIPFYALPYISDPKHHTLFRETFTEQWILNLENQLKLFMESYLKSTKKPKLYSLLQNENKIDKPDLSKEDYVHEIENYKNQILALKSNEETLDQKYNNLKNDYGHLVSLSSELVKVLSDSIQGEKISETFLYDISRQISMFEQKKCRGI